MLEDTEILAVALARGLTAAQLGVHPRTIVRWRTRGRLPGPVRAWLAVWLGACVPWPGWDGWTCWDGRLTPPTWRYGFRAGDVIRGYWDRQIVIAYNRTRRDMGGAARPRPLTPSQIAILRAG